MNKLILSLMLVIGFSCFDAAAQKPASKTSSTESRSATGNRSNPVKTDEKNKQTAEKTQKIKQALEDGVAAYGAKNYELAVEKFDEGFRLDPDSVGSAPVFLNNKASALRLLGVEKYNAAVGEGQTQSPAASQHYLDAIAALKLSQKMLDEAAPPNDEALKLLRTRIRLNSENELIETYRVLVASDETRIYEAVEFFENYIKSATDEYQKERAEEVLKALKTKYKINY